MTVADSPLLLAELSTAQIVRWSVWFGLLAVTVALVLLARTRWGQTHPLGKCIVLSLLAHVLLGLYASTVSIITGGGGGGDGGEVTVSLVDGPEGNPLGTSPDGPWNAVGAPPAGNVAGELPQQELPPSESPPQPIAQPAPAADLPGTKEVTSGQARQDDVSPPARVESPSKPAEPIETVPPQRNDQPAADVPAPPDTPLEGEPETSTAARPAASVKPVVSLPARDDEGPSGDGASTGRSAAASEAVVGEGDLAVVGVPGVYQNRVRDRAGAAQRGGGSPDTEAAVEAALKFLAEHQQRDGRWSCRDLGGGADRVVDAQRLPSVGLSADTGVTGLALLAFLAAGNTHERGAYAANVQRGLEYLLSVQARDGNLCGAAKSVERTYCHAMAGFALSEAYAMSRDDRLKAAVVSAVQHSLAMQDRTSGGWRYDRNQAGDTSQLGWQVMFLKSAELAGIPIPGSARSGVERFLAGVSSGRSGGLASYQPRRQVSRPMTAEALVCRQFLSLGHTPELAREASDYVLEDLPGAADDNVYYWYYASLALYQEQGPAWEKWNDAMQRRLLSSQLRSGDLAGSWDPDPIWGQFGGRAYSTSLSTLCLEVYYRYLPLYADGASGGTARRAGAARR